MTSSPSRARYTPPWPNRTSTSWHVHWGKPWGRTTTFASSMLSTSRVWSSKRYSSVAIDRLAAREPTLFEKYLYVGASRAATYLGITCGGTLPEAMAPLRRHFRAGLERERRKDEPRRPTHGFVTAFGLVRSNDSAWSADASRLPFASSNGTTGPGARVAYDRRGLRPVHPVFLDHVRGATRQRRWLPQRAFGRHCVLARFAASRAPRRVDSPGRCLQRLAGDHSAMV